MQQEAKQAKWTSQEQAKPFKWHYMLFLKQNNSVNQTACLNHLFVSSFCAANAQDFRTAYLYLKWPLSLSLFLPVCSSHQNKHKNKEKTHKFWLFWGTTIDSAC